ncbi:MAG: VOC family protein [Gammaproteobacteria bacterium]|nr:VOC family protein [Gammaproteobacteria bacterium]
MLVAVCVGTNDLLTAGVFYDQVLETLNMSRVMQNAQEIGYGLNGKDSDFYVLTPFNGASATSGNGSQVMFLAGSQQAVRDFYRAAMQSGGSDEGEPGPRDYAEGYYGAYVRDIDGNKLHVFHLPEK